jgi:phosphoglycerate kinase
MHKKLSVNEISVSDKRVLMRVDFNVPLDSDVITDNTRITAAIPTIKLLQSKGAKIILMSHLGRPKGKFSSEFSLKPIAAELSKLLNQDVKLITEDPDDYLNFKKSQAAIGELKSADVVLLENMRFFREEELYEKYDSLPEIDKKKVDTFLDGLASLGDVFVNDAFGTAHRAHASTVGIAKKFSVSACGLLMEKELKYLGGLLSSPEKPFIAILGGAKVSDKIGVINNLLPKVNAVLIGGAMSYTFLKAKGIEVGKSLVESEQIQVAANIIEQAALMKVDLWLPLDHVLVRNFASTTADLISSTIPNDMLAVDIGPKTIDLYRSIVSQAKTVVWNGPMGVFEKDEFAKGTFSLAQALSQSEATTVVGGGDSVAAINKGGYAKNITHISTGGGASLEFLEGIELPGVAVLTNS